MMGTSYRDFTIANLRLVVLQRLAGHSQYTCNAYVLQQELQREGHSESTDLLRTQLAWLDEQGLVRVVSDPPVMVATLTERGLDVADGRAQAPGVQRPAPI